MGRRRVRIENLKEGMILADDVYNASDQMVIPRKTVLTNQHLEKLSLYRISAVTVVKEETEQEREADEAVTKEIKVETRAKSKKEKQMEQLSEKAAAGVQSALDNLVKDLQNQDVLKNMVQDVKNLLESMQSAGDVFDLLVQIHGNSDLIYQHSLNVALVSVTLGRWLRFSEEDLEVLLMAGLLHDIGKLLIPKNILLKPNKLDEKEYHIMKSHTVRGYHLIKNMEIDERVKLTVLMHHERCDGSGYPMGIEHNKINSFAKIVAIADVYDAMTSNRSYRNSICPFDVIHQFEEDGLHLFEIEYIMTFLRNIATLYIHNRVKLSDGREGEIIMINPNHVSRPLVQIEDNYIDLSKESEIKIVEMLAAG